MIPEFDSRGNLPPGIHTAAWNEFKEKFGYNGHRKRLMGGMCEVLKNLRHAGCSRAYIDGSFVTGKQRPNDYSEKRKFVQFFEILFKKINPNYRYDCQ